MREYLDPEDHAVLYEKNQDLRKRHELLDQTAINLPRDPEGRLRPRSQLEEMQTDRYYREKRRIPPYDPSLPTHHFGKVSIALRDWREEQVPSDRSVYKDVSQAFLRIEELLTSYRPKKRP